ncbi:MAG TPA: DUF6150 family protein [Dissulfurispiraceae bacterium]|nr:DUF6150 family protein [Dissulfurispiraceae bacterium]
MAKIFVVDNKNEADAKVFEVKYASDADLIYYVESYANDAEGDARWFFVKYKMKPRSKSIGLIGQMKPILRFIVQNIVAMQSGIKTINSTAGCKAV